MKPPPDSLVVSDRSGNRLRRLRTVLQFAAVVLMLKVVGSIVWEYRFYFPPDFEANFLIGRETSFHGLYRFAFYTHILSGPAAILLAIGLMVTGRLNRFGSLHQMGGRVLAGLVLVGVAPTGLIMAGQTHAGSFAASGFALHAIAVWLSALATLVAGEKGNRGLHRRWATRCFLLLSAPLLFRIFAGALTLIDPEDTRFYPWNAWLSWLLPLIVYDGGRTWFRLPPQFWRPAANASLTPSSLRFAGAADVRSRGRPVHRQALTLLELLIVVGIIVVLVALILPSVRSASGAARRMSCSNNLKQLALSLHLYHDAHSRFPSVMWGTEQNQKRLSGWVATLPHLEQKKLWEQINAPLQSDSKNYPAMGPPPWEEGYPPWRAEISVFHCPSAELRWRESNYAFCIGDSTAQIHQPTRLRGVFGVGFVSRFDEITDGTSNTIAIAEIGTRDDRAVVGQFAVDQPSGMLSSPARCLSTVDPDRPAYYADEVRLSAEGRGYCWADGAAGSTLFNTVLPPNSPSGAVDDSVASDGIFSAGSYHVGGSQVAMADGSVRFIAETIDAGDPSTAPVELPLDGDGPQPPSPYGVWGALGTAAGDEPVREY